MCLAIPGEVVSIVGDDAMSRTAQVSFWGAIKQVSLTLAPDACVGDYVLVHAGFAIAVLDRQAAQQTLEAVVALDQDLSQKEAKA